MLKERKISVWINTVYEATELMVKLLAEDPFSQRSAAVPDLATVEGPAATGNPGAAAHCPSASGNGPATAGTESATGPALPVSSCAVPMASVDATSIHSIKLGLQTAQQAHVLPSGSQTTSTDSQHAAVAGSYQQVVAGHYAVVEDGPQAVVDRQQAVEDSQQASVSDCQQAVADNQQAAVVDSCQALVEDSQQATVESVVLWRTPSASTWKQISNVAVRALRMLQNALALDVNMPSTDASSMISCTAVQYSLIRLIRDLLIGHLKDTQLDFSEITQVGVVPIMRAWGQIQLAFPPLNKLVMPFLNWWMHEEIDRLQTGSDWPAVTDLRYAQMHSIWGLLSMSSHLLHCHVVLCAFAILSACIITCHPACLSFYVCLYVYAIMCLHVLSHVCVISCVCVILVR